MVRTNIVILKQGKKAEADISETFNKKSLETLDKSKGT